MEAFSCWWFRTGYLDTGTQGGGLPEAFPLSHIIESVPLLNNLISSSNTLQWLLSRRQRAQFDPRYRDAVPGDSYGSDQYGMHAYPPPVYDPNSAPPPKYQPPEGASKIDPIQGRAEASSTPVAAGEPSPAYAPPPGPPPSALHANQTGTSTTSNNPFRQ